MLGLKKSIVGLIAADRVHWLGPIFRKDDDNALKKQWNRNSGWED